MVDLTETPEDTKAARCFRRGLVVGKFYPPHWGHHALVEAALAQSEKVWVLVIWRPEEKIPGELRAHWMQAAHPQAHVKAVLDTVTPGSHEDWARATIDWLGFAPDAAFSSEQYGEPWARAMGAQHISVDPERSHNPISGTAVRSDPKQYLERLRPEVRTWLQERIERGEWNA